MDKNKQTHILIIRLSAMGDVAMTVPVLRAFVAKYPEVKITLLTTPHFATIFDSFTTVNVVKADVKGKYKGVFGLNRLYKELKPLQITAVADLHNVLRSKILKFFFELSGTKVVQIDKGRREKKALTRAKHKIFTQLKTTHERYADVFKTLGYSIDLNKTKHLESASLNENSKTVTGAKTQKWIGIAPFAAHEGKMYPLHLMKQVISLLSGKENYRVLLFGGGKKENDILNGIETELKGNVTSIAGKLSFSEELSVVSNLDLMLSMDSGNAHLAANYGVSVVSLWGVTHPYAGFASYGQPRENALVSDRKKYPLLPTSVYGNKLPNGYEKVMETILPETVIATIERILNS